VKVCTIEATVLLIREVSDFALIENALSRRSVAACEVVCKSPSVEARSAPYRNSYIIPINIHNRKDCTAGLLSDLMPAL
jgi:hypothetical protein